MTRLSITLLIAPLVLVVFLAGCNQLPTPVPKTEITPDHTPSPSPRASITQRQPSLTPNPTTQPVPRLEIQSSDLQGVVIRFWHTWQASGKDVIQALVDEFNLSNEWKMIIVPVQQGSLDEMSINVNAALQTGETPDLVVGYLHQAQAWETTGKLVDLNPYVQDPVWGLSSEEQADFYPIFWEQDRSSLKRLGVPAQRSGQVLFYNRTWAQELGYAAPPISPDQFREQVCDAAAANLEDDRQDNDGTGGWAINTHYSAMLGWIYAFGGEIIRLPPSGSGQSVYRFDSAQIEDSFTFLRSLYDNGCAWLPESQFPVGDNAAEFADRRALFISASVMDIPHQAQTFRQAGNNDEWTVIPFPSPAGQPAINVYGPAYEIISSSPERQLAAWVFMKWLLSPANQARLVEATGTYPVRTSVRKYLVGYETSYPQWAVAVELLSMAHTEPPYPSWNTVRWAVSDASTQLFRSYFKIDQVPLLAGLLDQTADELDLGPDLEQIFATETVSPTPGPSPTKTMTIPTIHTLTPP